MNYALYFYIIAIPPLAICFGIFGSFSMWEKSSFFGHSFSHSLLLPMSLALFFQNISSSLIVVSTIVFSIIFVFLFYKFGQSYNKYYNQDTLLIIASFFCLGISLFLSSINRRKIDVMMYLSGDIMFMDKLDIALLYIITICLVVFVVKFYNILVLRIISSELSVTNNKKAEVFGAIFMLLYAIFVAISSRAVGILLVSAVIILPSAIARIFAKNPKQMIIFAIFIGFITMMLGASGSLYFDIQFSPMVIFLYMIIFCGTYFRAIIK